MADSHRTPETAPQPIEWECDECGFPIADGRGAVTALFAEISDPESDVYWSPLHSTCADGDRYSVPVEKIRTHAGLLRWTAHLIEKTWVARSSWSDLIRDKAGVDL